MKISIALCTYNGEKYVSDQIQSLLSQTRLPDEIVISDDGSSDQTLAIIERLLKDSNIEFKIFKQSPSLGVYKNFEFCMKACQYDLIFPCDQDDVWKKDKLERHLKMHDYHEDKVLVYSNADVVQNTVDHYLYPLWDPIKIANQSYSSQSNMLYLGKSIAGCCLSIRRDFFQNILPIPSDIYHDDWCAASASLIDGIIGIPEGLIYYRQHGANVVGTIRGTKLSYWKSLLTNVPFYVNSDNYIYKRNIKVFTALMNHKLLRQFVKMDKLNEVLEYFKYRSDYSSRSIRENIKGLNLLLKRGDYHLSHGVFTYLKDIYNIFYMKTIYRNKVLK